MRVHHLSEGAFLLESEQGLALFGCPPEMLKNIRQKQLGMPDTLVLSGKLYSGQSSQAAIEFFLYDFLFVQQGLASGRKLRVIVDKHQQEKLTEMLRVTLVGPTHQEMIDSGMNEKWASQIIKETTDLALKKPNGEIYRIDDLIEWQVLPEGETINLWPASNSSVPTVNLTRKDSMVFEVKSGDQSELIDLTVKKLQKACYDIEHKTVSLSQKDATVTILGSSDGFDPFNGSNGCLFNFEGRIGLWDCPPYLSQHLKTMGLELNQIEAMFISHVHDDHLDVMESVCREKPLHLYCTPEVYYSMVIKLAALLDCSLAEASQYHQWHLHQVGESFQALGASFEFFYSVHSIPSVGCRIQVPEHGQSKRIMISGDNLPFTGIHAMYDKGVLPEARFKQSTNLIQGNENIVLIDAGGGMIHGDYNDYMSVENRVFFYHTSRIDESTLDSSKVQVKSGMIIS